MITNEQFLKEHFNEIFSEISIWQPNSYHYLLKIIDIKDDYVKIKLVVDNWPNKTELSDDRKEETILNVNVDVKGNTFHNFDFEFPKNIYLNVHIIETIEHILDLMKGQKKEFEPLFTYYYLNLVGRKEKIK